VRTLVRLIAGAVMFYAGLLVLAHFFYRRLLYPGASRDDIAPPEDATVLECTAHDGVNVHALEFAGGGRRTIVYFHGNGEVVGDDVWIARELVRHGFDAVLVEYRGYGASKGGRPSERGLYADAEAVLDRLRSRGVDADKVVLWGMSLGTGVAAEMAARGRGSALVLVAPYTSILDMATHYVPFLPARWLMDDPFETLAKAPLIHVPTLVFHGTRDEVVPFSMGERVAGAIAGAKLIAIEGGHHTDLFLGLRWKNFGVARSFIDERLGL
jgi:pimeloyl-ACP methyl ester carboxylesterase